MGVGWLCLDPMVEGPVGANKWAGSTGADKQRFSHGTLTFQSVNFRRRSSIIPSSLPRGMVVPGLLRLYNIPRGDNVEITPTSSHQNDLLQRKAERMCRLVIGHLLLQARL